MRDSRRRREQKFTSESQNNDRIKTIGLFSFSPQSLPLSSFPLSFFNLCLPVFCEWYIHFTQITRSKNPKWVSFHDKQINFYRLESCWSWKVFNSLAVQASLGRKSLSSLWASRVLLFVSASRVLSVIANIHPRWISLKLSSGKSEKFGGFFCQKRQECCRAQSPGVGDMKTCTFCSVKADILEGTWSKLPLTPLLTCTVRNTLAVKLKCLGFHLQFAFRAGSPVRHEVTSTEHFDRSGIRWDADLPLIGNTQTQPASTSPAAHRSPAPRMVDFFYIYEMF